MAALIRLANKRVRIGQYAKDKKKERMVKKKGERVRKQHFVKRKRRQVMSTYNGAKAGYT